MCNQKSVAGVFRYGKANRGQWRSEVGGGRWTGASMVVKVLPSGYVNSLLLKIAIEIVSFPIKNGGSFHSYVNVYQMVTVCVLCVVQHPITDFQRRLVERVPMKR